MSVYIYSHDSVQFKYLPHFRRSPIQLPLFFKNVAVSPAPPSYPYFPEKTKVYLAYMCIRGYIQTFPDWVDNEIYAYSNKRSLRSKKGVMAAKLTRLTHKIAIQVNLVAEICTICSSRSRRPVRKPLDTPSCVSVCVMCVHTHTRARA
jgi:hypothetical protein